MTELEKWLKQRVKDRTVWCNQVLKEAKKKGWVDRDVRDAYDSLALSYIKQSNQSRKVFWYRSTKIHNWIWVRYEPILPVHWEWAKEILESKDYKEADDCECPRPKTWYADGRYINWTEESAFAKTYQTLWFDHTGDVARTIKKRAEGVTSNG